MRSVVTSDGRDDGEELVVNAEFQRFADHWVFRGRARRPRRPRKKGNVERPIRYMQANFIYGRAFVGDSDLDGQARRWQECIANVRPHVTTGEYPLDRFERDKRATLGPLAARQGRAVVERTGCCTGGSGAVPRRASARRFDERRRQAAATGGERCWRTCAYRERWRPSTRCWRTWTPAGHRRGDHRGVACRADRAVQQPPPGDRHAQLASACWRRKSAT